MQLPGNKKNIQDILKRFQEIDAIYFQFQEEFVSLIIDAILDYHPEFLLNAQSDDEFEQYANQIFNLSESVIDKDSQYPTYRIKEELKRMQELAYYKQQNDFNADFVGRLSGEIKTIIAKYFPGIYELSGDGFRLLEANVSYTSFVFLDWLYGKNQ